ncbi:hypothetical protein [uncultured Parabacteroides sp.]|uniref:hypothetical protein n=1 Tax=uncultured Parabacteroides sp. TaxID=512312 RepID=UPI00262C4080|nr:hypothetical protein [uncultured Parabacteroides sp.]
MLSLISGIFAAKNLGVSIMTYFKLVESVDAKINKLLSKEYESAMMLLGQAQYVSHPDTYREMLVAAVGYFNAATAIETRERLLLSYLGLMMCYFYLGEGQAVKVIQSGVAKLSFEASFWEKNGSDVRTGIAALVALAVTVASGGLATPVAATVAYGSRMLQEDKANSERELKAREMSFNDLKEAIMALNFI